MTVTEPGLWHRLRRIDFERKLALALVALALICGLATYWVMFRAPAGGRSIHSVLFVLNLDLVVLLLLGAVVGRRVAKIVAERRRGMAGSRLHVRLVALFAGVAVAPAIIVSLFSVFFLSTGLEAWFSERVRGALANSLSVAEAYLEEHKEIIRADALAMAFDLNRQGGLLGLDPFRLQQAVDAQAAVRSLTEAVVFDGTGQVLARSGLSFSMADEDVPVDLLQRAAQGEVITLTADSDDRVRALLRLDALGDVYLYVGRFVEAEVLGFMERTQEIASEYQTLASERAGIQITTAMLFGVVTLLLLLASIWIGLSLADTLVSPIGQLIVAADRVRGGDLLARVPESAEQDELLDLSRAFNRMTAQLSSQRRELVEANRKLDERRRFTEAVLAGVTSGILGVDGQDRVVLANRAALEFLAGEGGQAGGLTGSPLSATLPEVMPLLERARLQAGAVVEGQIQVRRGDVGGGATPPARPAQAGGDGLRNQDGQNHGPEGQSARSASAGGEERTLLVRATWQGSSDDGCVVTFDDITALLAAQRQAAWSEVAQRIAHEIKNPLTPIRLSAERLNRRYAKQITEGQENFAGAVTTIITQVDQIGRLIGEFSDFARMPAPVMREENLNEVIQQAVFLQKTAYPQVSFGFQPPDDGPVRLVCDANKIGQALTNLLQNAVQALLEPKPGSEERSAPAVRVSVEVGADEVVLEVADNGPGFPEDRRQRLLEPYVTTRAKGTGLGLAIVNKIMEEHGGKVELKQGVESGALARLIFPAYRRALGEGPGA